MARIRSIHPGIFTDEAFMSASCHARLLIFGIWCEAWDDGVFEWKPLTLKARIFPVDNVDLSALLDELAALDVVKPFSASGKNYGAIRNFQKFQRPKKPNSSSLLPSSLLKFVGAGEMSSEPVPNQYGTGSEKSAQMEDGGGMREEETDIPTSNEVGPDEPVETPAQRLWTEGLTGLVSLGVKDRQARPLIGQWLKACGDDHLRVLGAIQRAREHAPAEPIAWITAGFRKIQAKQDANHDRRTNWLNILDGREDGQAFIDGDYSVVGTH